jgi:hypothetical protein
VNPDQIEKIVGIRRHETAHYGRAVTDERTFYILHSQQCRDSGADLRQCPFSVALDRGIDYLQRWQGFGDRPVALGIWEDGHLMPIEGPR